MAKTKPLSTSCFAVLLSGSLHLRHAAHEWKLQLSMGVRGLTIYGKAGHLWTLVGIHC